MKVFIAGVLESLSRRIRTRAASARRLWRATSFDGPESESFKLSADIFDLLADDMRAMSEELLSGLTRAASPDTRDGMSIDDLKGTANLLRAKIKDIGNDVTMLKDNVRATEQTLGSEQKVGCDFSEAIANVQLAYRHVEDARMRLGKIIQALEGGVSKYDRRPEQQQA